MIRRPFYLFCLFVLALTSTATARAADFKPGELLVRFQPGANAASVAAANGLKSLAQLPGRPVYRFQIPATANPIALSAILRKNPSVAWAEPNYFARTPEVSAQQWIAIFDSGPSSGNYVNQGALAQVDFNVTPTLSTGAGVIVAIVDTGISTRNPSLAGKVMAGWNWLNNNAQTDDVPNGLDDNGNGVIDEGTGHGTMVAGIVALLAPRALLLPVKVLDSDGQGDLWSAVEGILGAVGQGARVLNCSFGISTYSFLLDETVQAAYSFGAMIVTSAGNGSTNQPQYPAGLSQPMTVAALNADNTKASFSNYGSWINVCAPGVGIYSTYWNGDFGVGSGTSFAAPFATAAAALVWSAAPGLGNYGVQGVVRNTARSVDSVNPPFQGSLGSGLIDVDRAVHTASGR